MPHPPPSPLGVAISEAMTAQNPKSHSYATSHGRKILNIDFKENSSNSFFLETLKCQKLDF